MSVSAAQVKELRERTGAGMMECKKALEATQGDIVLAADELRKSGKAKADKKAGRIAAEGSIIIRLADNAQEASMIEVNSETDFVARDENFVAFANEVALIALASKTNDIQTLANLPFPDNHPDHHNVNDAREALVAKVGENIHIRRIVYKASAHKIGYYLHSNRIGVLVELDVDNPELAKDIAMHIAASKPLVITPDEVPADIVAKEKEIYMAQAMQSGKSKDIVEKMVAGRIKKYLDEVSLLGQPFVKDPTLPVVNLLNKNRAKVLSFTRFEVGEGIEKVAEDFVGSVMAQVQSSD